MRRLVRGALVPALAVALAATGCAGAGSGRAGGLCYSVRAWGTASGTPFGERAEPGQHRGRETGELDHRADERGREPEHRASAYEVTTTDLAACVRLDEVELHRSDVPSSPIETLPIHGFLPRCGKATSPNAPRPLGEP